MIFQKHEYRHQEMYADPAKQTVGIKCIYDNKCARKRRKYCCRQNSVAKNRTRRLVLECLFTVPFFAKEDDRILQNSQWAQAGAVEPAKDKG